MQRSYTPTTSDDDIGFFELLIKVRFFIPPSPDTLTSLTPFGALYIITATI